MKSFLFMIFIHMNLFSISFASDSSILNSNSRKISSVEEVASEIQESDTDNKLDDFKEGMPKNFFALSPYYGIVQVTSTDISSGASAQIASSSGYGLGLNWTRNWGHSGRVQSQFLGAYKIYDFKQPDTVSVEKTKVPTTHLFFSLNYRFAGFHKVGLVVSQEPAYLLVSKSANEVTTQDP